MDNTQQDIWLKAAVIGSIWASFEIVFGSFFHSLRLPFAGTFLTFSSIVLLTAFSYKWQDKNLYIKASIIAALMRSLIPTSIILGPLIGILVEATLFQLSVNLFGRHLFSFALAGILAMFSAIIHKIISIILIYGFDIIKILKNLYHIFLHITHLDLPPGQLFLIAGLVYVLLGITAALTGQWTGQHLTTITITKAFTGESWNLKTDLFDVDGFHYHSKYLFIHVLLLITFLFGLELYPLVDVIFPVSIYLLFLIKRYGKSLRRLSKMLFWIQLIIIVLISVWLWQDKTEGLLVGLKMVLRAILVVSSFTAISVELKNPLIKALLYKKGYSQLYATLSLATAVVPFILKYISEDRKILFRPIKVLQKAIALSDVLLQEFKRQIFQRNNIFIISGETRSGKTTFLKKVIAGIKHKYPSAKIGGIIAHGTDFRGERYGFHVENIITGEKQHLCSRDPANDDDIKTGRFYFYRSGLDFGNQAILENLDTLDLLVIDEIGYLELKGKGWFEAIEKAMSKKKLDMIFVVRKRILENVLKLWQNKHFIVVDITNNRPEFVVNHLIKSFQNKSS